jgi:DNA repair protein RecO (recombination protein O)
MSAAGNRVVGEPAFVLHRRAYRETSLLVELFTRHHGRIGVVARGARRGRSPLASLLEPFRPLTVGWSGRGELGTLIGADPAGHAPLPPGDRLLCGLYVNELVMGFIARGDANEALFDRYQQFVRDLAGSGDRQPLLRLFERDLLTTLGYDLGLLSEADTGRSIEPYCWYRYEFERGLVRNFGPGDERVYAGSSLIELAHGQFSGAASLCDAKGLLAAAIDHYRPGRPARTLQMMAMLEGDRGRDHDR